MFEFHVSYDQNPKQKKNNDLKEFQHTFKYLLTLIAKKVKLMLNRVGC